jgi:hypothetical protein
VLELAILRYKNDLELPKFTIFGLLKISQRKFE